MNIYASLRETITHWPVTGTDDYGSYTYGTPTTQRARWEETQTKFINAEGEEVVSRAVITLSRAVATLDFIAPGDLTHEATPTRALGAYQVRGYSRTSNLRNSQNLMQAFI